MRKYFVSAIPGTWDSTEWSTTSGGLPGLTPPGSNETAIFDVNSSKCLINTAVSIANLVLDPDYESTLVQQSFPINISSDASMLGGHFLGEGSDIFVGKILMINRCNMISTNRTLTLGGNLCYQEDPLDEKNMFEEEVTLSAGDISNKSVSLAFPPSDASQVVFNVLNGVPQEFGVDYIAYGISVDWSGLTLDGYLEQDDIVRVTYNTEETGFAHNRGIVAMKSNDNVLSGGGIRFYDLKISEDGENYFRISTGSNIENSLYLEGGKFLTGSDATLHIQGNLMVGPGFGARGAGRKVFMVMDGSGNQNVTFASDAILPTFGVDKTTAGQVKAYGVGPIRIDGNLELIDGTFNTNGLHVELGLTSS